MFTVRNTLVGAVLSAMFVWFPLFRPGNDTRLDAGLSAWCAMQHVWFLLAHLHVRRAAREGRPAVWPAPST